PLAKSPMCRSFPSSGAPTFPICALRTIRTVPGSGRIASVMPRSRISGPTTSPVHRPSAARNAAPQADPRRVDRLLPERPEPFPLERGGAVLDLAAGKERLQPVVGGAGQHHAPQDFDALVAGERGLNG